MVYVEALAIVLLTLLNGFLAMSELAVVSSRRSRLAYLASLGSRGARAALRLVDDPGRFLSTVQIGITLVGVVAGAFGGATLGHRLGVWLNTHPAISPYGIPFGVGLTIVGITYLSLILGELVPKRVALGQSERIASLVSRPMLWLSAVAAPAVWVLHVSTERTLRLLGLSGVREARITEEEVKSLIAEGTQVGVFAPEQKAMLEGVLRLADRPVRLIMTPRTEIAWVDAGTDRSTLLGLLESRRVSRIVVCDGTVDQPVGIVRTKDLLPLALRSADVSLADAMTPLLCVPESTPILHLLRRFRKERSHIAVVVDEYGATEGLVTLTDVMELIAGSLPEQGENATPLIVQRHDGSWLADGTIPTDEVEARTGIRICGHVKTLAGFMLDHLGRIPESGASFIHANARFEVVDMDGNRIDKVLIQVDRSRHQPADTAAPPEHTVP